MQLRGRHWVLLWLALFLGVALVVAGRQSAGYEAAGQVRVLREERLALEAKRADLVRRIREASSRRVLGDRAEEALGMHYPSDTEQRVLPVPWLGPEAP